METVNDDNESSATTYKVPEMRVPDKDGNCAVSGFPARAKNHIVIKISKLGRDGNVWFSTVLPDHVFEKLKDREFPKDRYKESRSYSTTSHLTFKKTIRRTTHSNLIELYNQCINDYLYLIKADSLEKNKAIFIKWNGKNGACRCSWNGSKLGEGIDMNFSFFVGFYSEFTHTNGEIIRSYYDINLGSINSTYTNVEKDYQRIKWTQEKEDYFTSVMIGFVTLKDNLQNHLADITEDKVAELIISKKRLLT